MMALKPLMALAGPGRFLESAGGPRVSWMFPLRMLRVRALADSSGYMVSRIDQIGLMTRCASECLTTDS